MRPVLAWHEKARLLMQRWEREMAVSAWPSDASTGRGFKKPSRNHRSGGGAGGRLGPVRGGSRGGTRGGGTRGGGGGGSRGGTRGGTPLLSTPMWGEQGGSRGGSSQGRSRNGETKLGLWLLFGTLDYSWLLLATLGTLWHYSLALLFGTGSLFIVVVCVVFSPLSVLFSVLVFPLLTHSSHTPHTHITHTSHTLHTHTLHTPLSPFQAFPFLTFHMGATRVRCRHWVFVNRRNGRTAVL